MSGEIEKNSEISFIAQETIFMYETWDNNRKEIITQTLGFSFAHRSSTEDEVSFGYVDYNDLKELFLKKLNDFMYNKIFNTENKITFFNFFIFN